MGWGGFRCGGVGWVVVVVGGGAWGDGGGGGGCEHVGHDEW